MLPLTNLLRGNSCEFSFPDTAVGAFNRARKALADTSALVHPKPDAPLSIVADASNFAIGAALQQQTPTGAQPLAFYSAKVTPPQTRCSTFGRELLAIYLAIKHFRNYIEGRDFCIYTDHKPFIYALSTSSDKYSPRKAHNLNFISQYSTDIRFLKSHYNQVADCLSRPGINAITRPSIDLERMAELQNQPTFTESLQHTSLHLEAIPLSTTTGTILCDVSRSASRPVVPSEMRRDVFAGLHNLVHLSIRTTQRLVSERFVWPNMNTDIRQWTRSCLACQKAKVGRHNKAPIGSFLAPDARFAHAHIDLPDSAGHSYGPDSNEVLDAIEQTNDGIAYLMQRIEQEHFSGEKPNIIVTSDHGMTAVSHTKIVNVSAVLSKSEYKFGVDGSPANLGIWVNDNGKPSVDDIYNRLKKNLTHATVYKKADIPESYHYGNNSRVPDIVVIADLGWMIQSDPKNPYKESLRGMHGYNNSESDMHPFLVAAGPGIKRIGMVDNFHQIDVYPFVCLLLKLYKPNRIDGDVRRVLPFLTELPSMATLNDFEVYAKGLNPNSAGMTIGGNGITYLFLAALALLHSKM
ncbi:Bis(5'-adenosyl)-triphosphatase enpp4 [Sparganum proliferum]